MSYKIKKNSIQKLEIKNKARKAKMLSNRINLLLIEDSQDDAELICYQLRNSDYVLNLKRVDNAVDMKTALREREWDMVISDYYMPSFNGIQALEILREFDPLTPFILVSGVVGEHFATEIMQAGAQDYVLKSNLTRLSVAVRRELKEKKIKKKALKAAYNLKVSEAKYRTYIENSPVSVFVTNKNGKFIDTNEASLNLLGWPKHELYDLTLFNLITEDKWKLTLDEVSLLPKQKTCKFESKLKTKSNEIIHVFINAVKLSNNEYLYFCTNITEQKTDEEKLRSTMLSLDTAQTIAKLGSWEYDIDNKQLIWSGEHYRIFGWEFNNINLNKSNIRAAIHPEDFKDINKKIRKVIKEGGILDVECRIITPDEHEKYIHVKGEIILNSQGKIIKANGTTQDISLFKRNQIELNEQRMFLEQLIDSIPDQIYWKDKEFIYRGCNTEFAQKLGFKNSSDIVGKLDSQLLKDREKVMRILRQDQLVINHGKSLLQLEEKFTDDNGKELTYLTSKVPVRNAQKQVVGILGIMVDITNMKVTEEKLRNAHKELESFFYRTSHDLRAPVTSVLGLLNLIGYTKSKDELDNYLDRISITVEKLDDILLDLIEVTHVRAGILTIRQISLKNILQDISQTYLPIKSKQIKFTTSLNPEMIYSDDRLMNIIFRNFIDNSVRYRLKNGQPQITVSSWEKKNRLYIEVMDNGKGIRKEAIPYIFNMFTRGDIEKLPGAGLGLFVVKNAVERLGGSISVEAQWNNGSKFLISLPAISEVEFKEKLDLDQSITA